MTVTLKGMDKLAGSFTRFVKSKEKGIADLRKEVAKELVDALLSNVPVWSGRTARSIAVSNTASGGNITEVHPDRRNTSRDGKWLGHKGDFGDTRNMPLGAEPMRAGAEAIARATVELADYSMDSAVYVTSSSYNWGDVDKASYRDDARNTPIVSEIAKAQVRAMFGKRIK